MEENARAALRKFPDATAPQRVRQLIEEMDNPAGVGKRRETEVSAGESLSNWNLTDFFAPRILFRYG